MPYIVYTRLRLDVCAAILGWGRRNFRAKISEIFAKFSEMKNSFISEIFVNIFSCTKNCVGSKVPTYFKCKSCRNLLLTARNEQVVHLLTTLSGILGCVVFAITGLIWGNLLVPAADFGVGVRWDNLLFPEVMNYNLWSMSENWY